MTEGPRRVVITGAGIVCPLGNDVETAWRRLVAGESGIAGITRFDPLTLWIPHRRRGQGLRPDGLHRPARGAAHGRWTRTTRSRRPGRPWRTRSWTWPRRPEDIGGGGRRAAAAGSGPFEVQQRALFERGPQAVSPFFATMMIPNMAAGQVALHFGANGPNCTPTTACASGASGVGEAFTIISGTAAEAMLAGGAEAPVLEHRGRRLRRHAALSTLNDGRSGRRRPFDAGRDGFVIAEGAGVLRPGGLGTPAGAACGSRRARSATA